MSVVAPIRVRDKEYQLRVKQGEDFLLALDIFLKKHKINWRDISFPYPFSFKNTGLISQRIIETITKTIIIAKEWL